MAQNAPVGQRQPEPWAEHIRLMPAANEGGYEPLALVGPTTTSWVHGDHLGTPVMITSTAGARVNDMQATPFGARWRTAAGSPKTALALPGQIIDVADRHYNMHRDYDPTLGRYLQADPIGLGGGDNVYGYVEGNPVTGMDPEGLQSTAGPRAYLGPGGSGRNPFASASFAQAQQAAREAGTPVPAWIGPPGSGPTTRTARDAWAQVNRDISAKARQNQCPADGIIYRRIDSNPNGLVPYYGQTSEAEFLARKGAHLRNFPNSLFDFETIATGLPRGSQRDIAEYNAIQEATGGVAARRSSAMSNQRDPVGAGRRALLGIPEPK